MKNNFIETSDLKIDDTVIGLNNKKCKISNLTINSVEVFLKRTNSKGINHKQWFTIEKFNKEFKIQ